MIAKNNALIGLETRFGADWQGQRCGTKTRRGSPCQRPANKKNGRCRLHGGASSGPQTKEGRAKIASAKTTSSKNAKAMIARRKEGAKIAKGLRDWLRVIEQNLQHQGVID